MELKYYLRGLGLGIIITAIIMGVASSRGRAMTDAEIIARAKQLGMTEDKVLTETVSGEKDNEKNTPDTDEKEPADMDAENFQDEVQVQEPVETDDTISNPAEEEPAEREQEQEQETGQMQTGGENENNAPDENAEGTSSSQEVMVTSENSMVVTIGSGDGSYEVSQKLADIGAVPSAAAFDTFLCENGYDKRIRAGMHTIPVGASETQVARIITGME